MESYGSYGFRSVSLYSQLGCLPKASHSRGNKKTTRPAKSTHRFPALPKVNTLIKHYLPAPHTRTCTHTDTHTHTLTPMHKRTHTHSYALTLSYTHTHTHTHLHIKRFHVSFGTPASRDLLGSWKLAFFCCSSKVTICFVCTTTTRGQKWVL